MTKLVDDGQIHSAYDNMVIWLTDQATSKHSQNECHMTLKMINKLFDYLQSDAEQMSKSNEVETWYQQDWKSESGEDPTAELSPNLPFGATV